MSEKLNNKIRLPRLKTPGLTEAIAAAIAAFAGVIHDLPVADAAEASNPWKTEVTIPGSVPVPRRAERPRHSSLEVWDLRQQIKLLLKNSHADAVLLSNTATPRATALHILNNQQTVLAEINAALHWREADKAKLADFLPPKEFPGQVSLRLQAKILSKEEEPLYVFCNGSYVDIDGTIYLVTARHCVEETLAEYSWDTFAAAPDAAVLRLEKGDELYPSTDQSIARLSTNSDSGSLGGLVCVTSAPRATLIDPDTKPERFLTLAMPTSDLYKQPVNTVRDDAERRFVDGLWLEGLYMGVVPEWETVIQPDEMIHAKGKSGTMVYARTESNEWILFGVYDLVIKGAESIAPSVMVFSGADPLRTLAQMSAAARTTSPREKPAKGSILVRPL